MTDRINALTVVLEEDVRVDDAEALISAIRHIRGVRSVRKHVASMEDHIALERARSDLARKLWEVLGV